MSWLYGDEQNRFCYGTSGANSIIGEIINKHINKFLNYKYWYYEEKEKSIWEYLVICKTTYLDSTGSDNLSDFQTDIKSNHTSKDPKEEDSW